jgi:hypothetical protein
MKLTLTLSLLLISLFCFSQNIVIEATKNSDLQNRAYQLKFEPSSKQKIETTFTVDKYGTLTNLKAFSEYPELKEEALKILNRVGKLAPREVKGEFVEQNIALPIIFKVKTQAYRLLRLRKAMRTKRIKSS